MGWSFAPHLEKAFKDKVDELNEIVGYTVERYVFGETKDGFKPPPPIQQIEIHVFCDDGGDSFGAVAFLRWKDESVFKMRRIYASSRVVSPTSKLSVPRREVYSLVMGKIVKKALNRAWNRWRKSVFTFRFTHCHVRARKGTRTINNLCI